MSRTERFTASKGTRSLITDNDNRAEKAAQANEEYWVDQEEGLLFTPTDREDEAVEEGEDFAGFEVAMERENDVVDDNRHQYDGDFDDNGVDTRLWDTRTVGEILARHRDESALPPDPEPCFCGLGQRCQHHEAPEREAFLTGRLEPPTT